MKLNNSYIIGCHIMFYEIEMVEEYFRSVRYALEEIENPEKVRVDILFNVSQYFEDCESQEKLQEIKDRCENLVVQNFAWCGNFRYKFYSDDEKPYTMADYRRELNNKGIDYDYTIWGESDCLMPRQLFVVLEQISQHAKMNNINRYITTFAVRKMWDDSWKVLEHNEFTDKPYYDMDTEEDKKKAESSPWSIRYTMSQEEMDELNNKVDELDVRLLTHPKFDGSGLVISKDLLMTGANLPPAVYMNGDDSAFLQSCLLHMGQNYRQFVIKNILKVHNRNHPKKRNYVMGEDNSKNTHFKRATRNWYKEFNEVSKGNMDKLYYSQEPFSKKEIKK